VALIRKLATLLVVFTMFCPGSFGSPSPSISSFLANSGTVGAKQDSKTKKANPGVKRIVKSIKVGKIRRSYVVNVPAGYGEKQAPVVLVLHGAMANTFSMAWDTRMTEKANEHGFIVVYPRGIGIAKTLMTWNAGDCCGVAKLRNIDDIAFLKTLIKQIREDYNVDADRIYMAGASNGGMMAYKAAIELSDQIAAIATANGTMMTNAAAPGEPVSILAFHGTKDHIVPYEGGPGGLPFWKIVGTRVADNVKFWVERDGCSNEAVREKVGNCVKETYGRGVNGTEVCVYIVKDGKHNWPGGRGSFFLNDTEMSKVDATDIICKFFLAHPKVRTAAASNK
jgi:polyhydroxybutyrate depolymerase